MQGPGGRLDVLELGPLAPFLVSRIYWLRDTPREAVRGLHAHRTLRQLLVVLSGSVTVSLDDGHSITTHHLSEGQPPLLIEPVRWRELTDMREGTVIMVLASDPYDPDDYIHDYTRFLELVRGA